MTQGSYTKALPKFLDYRELFRESDIKRAVAFFNISLRCFEFKFRTESTSDTLGHSSTCHAMRCQIHYATTSINKRLITLQRT